MPTNTPYLHVKDSRTSQTYSILIRDNAVEATQFKQIKGPDSFGLKVYDEGLANTATLKSSLTYQDSQRGTLLFKGYSIGQLWNCDFEEILHLTLWSRLPNHEEKEALRLRIAQEMTAIPEAAVQAVNIMPKSSPPVPVVLAALSIYVADKPENIPAFMGGNIYHQNDREIDSAVIRTAAAWAVSVGLAISHVKGIDFTPPSTQRTYFENLFHMIGHVDLNTNKPDPIKLECFRRFGALSVDHGMTSSTFALLVTCSTLADPISGMIAALAAGYGPLHFGAPESAYKTIQKVGQVENVPALIEKVKRGEQRLFGYGHRSYQVPDPRIKPIQVLLEQLNAGENPLLAIAQEIDRLASQDEYFKKRGIQANADLYGVFFYIAEGFAPEQIPLLMITHRLPGILAHWRDSMRRPIKVIRPTHIYEGPTEPNPNRASKL
ncbi:putative citrate synthase [Xylariaceae sp. FL0662B]|nr:putative citrate synthase [Xylariaceae sp. FL0662B]